MHINLLVIALKQPFCFSLYPPLFFTQSLSLFCESPFYLCLNALLNNNRHLFLQQKTSR